MKSLFSVALIAVATPALAQTAPAPAPAPAAPAAATKFNLDTPIETIAADEKGKAVLDADLPGLLTHPMYDSFKSMSLTQVAPMSQGKMTDEVMKKVAADLAAIK